LAVSRLSLEFAIADKKLSAFALNCSLKASSEAEESSTDRLLGPRRRVQVAWRAGESAGAGRRLRHQAGVVQPRRRRCLASDPPEILAADIFLLGMPSGSASRRALQSA
jgi:hypothetical protein